MLAARVLAIVRAWSAWRALQGCTPTTKLLAGMPASEAAAERVFSALAVTVTAIREGH